MQNLEIVFKVTRKQCKICSGSNIGDPPSPLKPQLGANLVLKLRASGIPFC